MKDIIDNLPKLAKDKHKENKTFFTKLEKKPPKQLDYIMQELHDQESKQTDCLECANCCKTTGPLFTDRAIVRIAKQCIMKKQQITDSFLGVDNYCSIYDVRPKACSEFPHTDRKKFQQISNLTLKNVAICPAAFNIVEAMKRCIKL